MYEGIKVKAKKEGKGVRQPTKSITAEDMITLGNYFIQNFEGYVNPRKLQQCVMFYIIYFFCHRGQENLPKMTLQTYAVRMDPQGKKYIEQAVDEMDKNHNPNDDTPTNEGRMYENPGKNYSKAISFTTENSANRSRTLEVTKPNIHFYLTIT